MVAWKKLIKAIPTDIEEEFNKLLPDFEGSYPDRSDIARVRAFRKTVGLDAVRGDQDPDKKFFVDTYEVQGDKWLGKDDQFKYRMITMTASGVNLNKQYKTADAIKQVGLDQKHWTIPMVNDHPQPEDMEEIFFGPRLDPNDDEISGYCVILDAKKVGDEMELHAIEAVPLDDDEALASTSFSIGYYADCEYSFGNYKGKVYDEIQTNIFIIHNARMVTQTASVPAATVHDGAGAGTEEEPQPPGGGDMSDDEHKKAIAEKDKLIASQDELIKKAKDESEVVAGKLAKSSSDLKAANDKIVELEATIAELEPVKVELDKIKEDRLATLRDLVKKECPGSEENGSVFDDEALGEMDEKALKNVLKATGIDSVDIKFHSALDTSEGEHTDGEKPKRLVAPPKGKEAKEAYYRGDDLE